MRGNPGEAPRVLVSSRWELGRAGRGAELSREGPRGHGSRASFHHTPTQGVVPFLGTFLTDLFMLDTAMEEYLEVRGPGDGTGA